VTLPPGSSGGPFPVRAWCRTDETGPGDPRSGENAGSPVTNRINSPAATCFRRKVLDPDPGRAPGVGWSGRRSPPGLLERLGALFMGYHEFGRTCFRTSRNAPKAFRRAPATWCSGGPCPARPGPGPPRPLMVLTGAFSVAGDADRVGRTVRWAWAASVAALYRLLAAPCCSTGPPVGRGRPRWCATHPRPRRHRRPPAPNARRG